MKLTGARYRQFDRSRDEGLATYFARRLGTTPPASEFQWPPALRPPDELAIGGIRHFCRVECLIRLFFEGPMLVKAPIPPRLTDRLFAEDDPEEYARKGLETADHVFISGGADRSFYLPGSSLRGLLRSRAERIWASVGKKGSANPAERLFGCLKDATGGQKSRIQVSDGELISGSPIYLDHVAIDRITAAASDGRKFATCGLASPTFEARIAVGFFEYEITSIALWGFLLRDLLDNNRFLAGSGTTRGYGLLRNAAIVRVKVDLTQAGLGTPAGKFARCDGPAHRRTFAADNPGFEDFDWLWTQAQTKWAEATEA